MSLSTSWYKPLNLAYITLIAILLIQFAQSLHLRKVIAELSADLHTSLLNVSLMKEYISKHHSYFNHIRNIQLPVRSSNEGLVLVVAENACSPCVMEEIEIMKQAAISSDKFRTQYLLIPSSLKWKYLTTIEAHNILDLNLIVGDSIISGLFASVKESILYIKIDSTGRPLQYFFPVSSIPELSLSFCR